MNEKNDKVEKKIKIKKESKSGLAKFTQRPLPDENEVSDFENTVKKEIREEEIDDNLSEIYQDKKGNLVDVNNRSFKKHKSWLLIIMKNLLFLIVLIAGAYLAYYYYNNQYLGLVEAKIEITAPNTIKAGEEFSYLISIHNPSSVVLENLGLEIIFPSSFILTESSIEAEIANYWNLDKLLANETKTLEIKGKLYNRYNSTNPINLRLSYMPANFSSQFSQEASAHTIIDDIGFRLDLNYFNTALLGQDLDIDLSLLDMDENYLDNLIIRLDLPDSFSLLNFILKNESDDEKVDIIFQEIGVNKWQITNIPEKSDQIDFEINFKVNEKINEKENIYIRIYHQAEDKTENLVLEENLEFEVMQSDLHLALEINDNRGNQTVNFGDNLNYSLNYHNRSQVTLNDLVLMVIIEGEIIDWSSLNDDNKGRIFENVIVYSQEEISDLAQVLPNEKGKINFSIDLNNYQDDYFATDLSINSFAQYSFGLNEEVIERNEDNRSNLIEKYVNSNLGLKEEIRYFDDNNIPVGSGPLPPEVGQETSVRVYWTITNSLHELKDIEVKLDLPSYVNWKNRLQTNIGDLIYNEQENQIIWQIDNLPLSNYRADAEFNLSFIPEEDDRNKILILSPGAHVYAKDTITGGEIRFKTSPKTSRLEDDEIASYTNNGRVQ
jgi:hypothetical protein